MDAIFMVGEQRSGSNLLRIMLDQSEQIAGPHPPHILQRMMPLMPIYGDLSADAAFRRLVDDVCRVVEHNPVAWENITVFDRDEVAALCRERSLIAVYGAVMAICARANGKVKWLCKTMTNIKYAEELDAYFGATKYIFLYRDGRDVTLSFCKAVVGDKHPYFIAQKWAELQRLCLAKRTRTPERVFSVAYEDLTANTEVVLCALCDFLGVTYTPRMLEGHRSKEASRTAESSDLWQNLTKPIMCANQRKFLKELSEEHVRVIESVAGDCLDALGYDRVFVKKGDEMAFSAEQIAEFKRQNEEGIKAREEDADPGDMERRRRQQAVLDEIRARAK